MRLGTDLTRVAKKVEEGILNTRRDSSSELKRRSAVVSLGQGKWLDYIIDAFKPSTPSRAININQRDLKKPIWSSPPHPVSPPWKFAYKRVPAEWQRRIPLAPQAAMVRETV